MTIPEIPYSKYVPQNQLVAILDSPAVKKFARTSEYSDSSISKIFGETLLRVLQLWTVESKNEYIAAINKFLPVIDTIKNDLLKSPELTGQWEHKLRQMERGLYDPKQFKAELFQMVRELTDEVIFGN